MDYLGDKSCVLPKTEMAALPRKEMSAFCNVPVE